LVVALSFHCPAASCSRKAFAPRALPVSDTLLSLGRRCERHPVLAEEKELLCCNFCAACCGRTEMSLRYPEFGWRQSSGNRLKGVGCFWMNHVFNHQTLPIRAAADFPQFFCFTLRMIISDSQLWIRQR